MQTKKHTPLFILFTLLGVTTSITPSLAATEGVGLRPLLSDYGNLVNQGKCVDTQGGRMTDGSPLVLWECNGGNSQQWMYDERTLAFRNRIGKCIDVKNDNGEDGTALVLWECDSGRSQQWEHQGYRDSDNLRGLKSKCMATKNAGNQTGVPLILTTCNSRVYQQFWGQSLAAVSGSGSQEISDNAEVCVYELAEYKGWKKCFSTDQPNLTQSDIDDSISSLKIQGGVNVKMYEDRNYRGTVRTYTQDVPWVGDQINNKISSFKLELKTISNPDLDRNRYPTRPSGSTRLPEDNQVTPDGQSGKYPFPIPTRGSNRGNSSNTTTPTSGFVRLVSRGRCLDIHQGDFETRLNGGKLQIWNCHNGPNQDWQLDDNGRLLTRNGKCLDVEPRLAEQNGARLQVWECSNRVTQQWYFDQGRLRNQASGKCIDLDSSTMDRNGGKVQLWDCHDRSNQQWATAYSTDNQTPAATPPVTPPSSANADPRMLQEFFRLTSRGKCLDIHRDNFDSRINGANLQSWQCNNEVNQDWKFDDRGQLISRNGKCLEVESATLSQNGAQVQLWDCQNGNNQLWYLDNGRLRNRGNSKCLDLDSASANKDGGKVQMWECHDRSNQQWKVMYH